LTVHRPIVSFRIEGFQKVAPFPFLILNTTTLEPDAERVSKAQAKAEGIAVTFQDRAAAPVENATTVGDFRKPLIFQCILFSQPFGREVAFRKG
jgi:hypothetical protein